MADIPKAITRKDMYYSYLINGSGELPDPITRQDFYLHYLCTSGFGGGGGQVTTEMIDDAVKNYLDAHPVQPGATEEEARQIQDNKEAIENLYDDFKDLDMVPLSNIEIMQIISKATS